MVEKGTGKGRSGDRPLPHFPPSSTLPHHSLPVNAYFLPLIILSFTHFPPTVLFTPLHQFQLLNSCLISLFRLLDRPIPPLSLNFPRLLHLLPFLLSSLHTLHHIPLSFLPFSSFLIHSTSHSPLLTLSLTSPPRPRHPITQRGGGRGGMITRCLLER